MQLENKHQAIPQEHSPAQSASSRFRCVPCPPWHRSSSARLSRARVGWGSQAKATPTWSEHPHEEQKHTGQAYKAEPSWAARAGQWGLVAPVPSQFCPFPYMDYSIPWLQRECAWSNAAACSQLPVQQTAHALWRLGTLLPTSSCMMDGAGFVPKLFV